MAEKRYKLAKEQIKPLAVGHGACIASDHIVVDGKKVGFMYRESPSNTVDSGWRFFSGEEDQAYVDQPEHLAFYDINTVANYDPAIILHLGAAIGTQLGRVEGTDRFVQEKFTPPEE
ncbi:hypothetical protein CMV30_03000 [Nibricoccus aquaticus]|uniref:Immunity protein Imm33 domain-containing protein n=2 Tax=Nibricoccus aquaticus TaxID=2576891 RepID=A0A290QB79_9BACT|nr:hypothetical protein CMV30_03000 [Nibricoccus aquaticus]